MLYHWIISLPMMLCFFWSIFFFIRCLEGRNNLRIKVCILVFFIAATVLYTDHWLYFSEEGNAIGLWTYLIANLSVYPLYYMYLRALTHAKKSIETPLLFIPAAIIALLFPLNGHFEWFGEDRLILFVRICFAAEVIWVWWRGYLLLQETRARMDDTYSDDRSYLLRPTYIIQHLLGLTAAISMLLNVLGRDFFTESMLVCIPAVVMTALLYAIGYVAAHTTLPQETVEADSSTYQPPSKEDSSALMERIDRLMREQHLFTNSGLTIVDVATAAGSNRTYVSRAINRSYSISFSQYIARQRVLYAQMVLADARYKTDKEAIADAIALSGFASEQSFYRLFKEQTGTTPLQFRKQSVMNG